MSAGCPLMVTVGAPGVHGAVVTGMHGCGVSTPAAAAVAAATCGFAGHVHMPNGAMFAVGIWSEMFAAGLPPACTGGPFGMTDSEDGASPKLQARSAPCVTCIPIPTRYESVGLVRSVTSLDHRRELDVSTSIQDSEINCVTPLLYDERYGTWGCDSVVGAGVRAAFTAIA
jgi:hypothetical protein